MFNRVKRRAFVLLLGAACMMSSVASAQISNDRIAIGGVGPGCTPEYVESVYGPPTSQEQGSNGDQTYLEYNYYDGTDGEQLAFDVQNFYIVSISARIN